MTKAIDYNTITSNSIEELFDKHFPNVTPNQSMTEPMDEELSELLLALILSKKFEIPKKEQPWLFELIEKRLDMSFTFTIKPEDKHKFMIYLCTLTESPGNAVVYLWYLQYYCAKKNIKELSFQHINMNIFPLGYFKKETLKQIWNSQKVIKENPDSQDNLFDIGMAGESIQF